MTKRSSAHLRAVTPPEVEREREIAFANWLASAPTQFLECRDGKHIFPGYTDATTEMEIHLGVCYIDARCPRCGSVLHKLVGVKNGFLEHGATRTQYEYADGYLLPKEATTGHSMDKAHRAQVRLELLERGFAVHGKSLAKAIAADVREQSRLDKAAR